MLSTYRRLARLAREEFSGIVNDAQTLGGSPGDPNKLRLYFVDGSFLDIWLSEEDEYSYHWEHRAQHGMIHRWDNAPDHPDIETFPHHFHDGQPQQVVASSLPMQAEAALRVILTFVLEWLPSAPPQTWFPPEGQP